MSPISPEAIRDPLDSRKGGRYHSRREMVARAKEVLATTVYEKQNQAGGYFDDLEYDHGWMYLYS